MKKRSIVAVATAGSVSLALAGCCRQLRQRRH